MKTFTLQHEFKNAVLAESGISVKEIISHVEDPFLELIAITSDKKSVGYFSDGFGFLAENPNDVGLIRDQRSDYYIAWFGNH